MSGNRGITSYITSTPAKIIPLMLIILFTVGVLREGAKAQDTKLESPKRVIAVKDYKWASGGMGRPAIMREITLENRGKYDYENIAIEVDLYTTNDIPLGSLRASIPEILPAGSEKTFYNLKFGIMHAELKNTVARVVNADLIEKGTPFQAKDLIQVKNWEWSGGQYGTEGILKEITLVNRSQENWKDIKVRVDFLGIPGGKVGIRGFTSRAVIHDILPAGSEKTYYDINVGFRHPDARKVDMSVMGAKPISEKEVKIKQAKKEGKKARKKKKKRAPGDTSSGVDEDGMVFTQKEKKLSLSERYKQKLAEEKGEPFESTESGVDTPSAPGDVAMSETEPGGEEKSAKGSTADIETAQGDEVTEDSEEEYEYEYEEEVPLPEEDIVVEDFKWGGGVTGTIGRIDEITLRNLSGITYTKIELKIEFYSFKEETPMFSNRVTIFDVLPADSKKTFKDLKAGYLNAIPQEVRIVVLTAIPFNQ
ncbi:MAG: hypothetical protein RIG61_13395 [Deltaproteobacteria bacterium]